jgi:gliding motility-associated-like protein
LAALTLIVTPLLTSNTKVSVCTSQLPYAWNGKSYNSAGIYTDTKKSTTGGCDTLATLDLSISPRSTLTNSAEICAEDLPFIWKGVAYNTSGTYNRTLPASGNDCDTLATLVLKVKPYITDTTTVSVSVTQLPYVWRGKVYSLAGSYVDTVDAKTGGCDTISVLRLTLISLIKDTTRATVCSNVLPYIWRGLVYDREGTYTVLRNGNGTAPDTLSTLFLGVLPLLQSVTNVSVCANQFPYQWKGKSYSSPGTYSQTLRSTTGGCDTAAVLNLVQSGVLTSTVDRFVCSNDLPYSWNGKTYTSPGSYSVTLTGSSGCDSVVTLSLKVKPLINSFVRENTCSNRLPYVWNGNTYNASGLYVDTLLSSSGCDSIVTMQLSVKQTSSSITRMTICSDKSPYAWNGKSLTSTGRYEAILANSVGCDSIATLELIVNQVKYSTTDVVVCSNSLPFQWNGRSYSSEGQYKITLMSSVGCDSIVTLNLDVNPVKSSTTDVLICTTQAPYVWNGRSYGRSGTYSFLTKASNGCDSTAYLKLDIVPVPEIRVSAYDSICIGLSASIGIDLTGTGPWTLTYTDGRTTQTVTGITSSPYILKVSPTQKTTYRFIRATDRYCLNESLNVSMTIHVTYPKPAIRLGTVYAFSNESKVLKSRFLGSHYSYLWKPPTGLNSPTLPNPVFNYTRGIDYLIQMTSLAGCVTVDTLKVQMYDNNTDPGLPPDILVPKAWTPDGDGHNDQLFPFTINIREIRYFRIFNRWGQLMFESRKIGAGWDGMFNGAPQPIDAYTWTVEGVGFDGTVVRKAGSSALLR